MEGLGAKPSPFETYGQMGEDDMSLRHPPILCIALCAALVIPLVGCNSNGDFVTDDRLANGLVIILPGIEGESELNRNIRRGLIAGGIHRAMPIHSWGRPIPLAGVLINQVDFLGNRLAGIGVADLIINYQDSHPGKPVHIVGHSGGGGIAVFAAEALPKDRKIDGLILLSASISSAYDLTKAASRCSQGIVNFYNPDDAGLLGIGTTVVGTVDGTHGPSAGLIGFDKAGKKNHRNVYQVRLRGMDSGGDPHASTTRVGFVSRNVAPWALANEWPAGATTTRRHRPRTRPKQAKTPEKPDDDDKPRPKKPDDRKDKDKPQPATTEPAPKAPPEPKAPEPKKQRDGSQTDKPGSEDEGDEPAKAEKTSGETSDDGTTSDTK